MAGHIRPPPWLAIDSLLGLFATSKKTAQCKFVAYIMEGIDGPCIWEHLKHQIYLGNDDFIAETQSKESSHNILDSNIPGTQRRPPAPALAEIAKRYCDRNEAITAAYATGEYSYAQIADYFGVHFTTVGRVVRKMR